MMNIKRLVLLLLIVWAKSTFAGLCDDAIRGLYERMASSIEQPILYPSLLLARNAYLSESDRGQIAEFFKARFHGAFGGISGYDWFHPKIIRPFRIKTSDIPDSMFFLRVNKLKDREFLIELKPRLEGPKADGTELNYLAYKEVHQSVQEVQKIHPNFRPIMSIDEDKMSLRLDLSAASLEAQIDFLSAIVDYMHEHRAEEVTYLDILIMAENEHGPRNTEEDDQARPGEGDSRSGE
jgi:hypothetical protein